MEAMKILSIMAALTLPIPETAMLFIALALAIFHEIKQTKNEYRVN